MAFTYWICQREGELQYACPSLYVNHNMHRKQICNHYCQRLQRNIAIFDNNENLPCTDWLVHEQCSVSSDLILHVSWIYKVLKSLFSLWMLVNLVLCQCSVLHSVWFSSSRKIPEKWATSTQIFFNFTMINQVPLSSSCYSQFPFNVSFY
jgi:hypothetical protein